MKPLLAAALALVAAPAFAQQLGGDPLATSIMLAANPCNTAQGAPQAVIDTCIASLAEVEKIRAANTLNPHELNIYYVMVSAAHTTMGSRMGEIDRARTARTCTELETGWAALSRVIPSNSPPDYASDMNSLQQQAAGPVRLCRSEFGTPAGAPRVFGVP